MLSQIEHARAGLIKAGITPGDRVAILSPPSVEFYVATLACWKIGAIAVPVSTRYPTDKINSALKSVNCDKILVSSQFASLDIVSGVYPLDDFLKLNTFRTTPVTFDDLALDVEADASIIFTSGSSGAPKGVLHTIANHYYSASGSHDNIPFAKPDAWLASLPMYHISGFSLIMRSLIAGGAIVFPKPDQPLAEAVMHPAVTHLSLVPTQLLRLLDSPACVERMKRMAAILIGGSAVPSALIERSLAHDLLVCTTYGSTEAASQIATGKSGTAGNVKLLPYREVTIAPHGEILLKGKSLFKGYIRPDGIDRARDKDGFFHTGDTGTLDRNNHLYVTGRKDLMFICGGENIHPEEIERALENLPGIEQAIVVPVTDKEFGQRPAAFIKTKNNTPLDTEKIGAELKNHLEPFKIPKTFHPWPQSLTSGMKPSRELIQSFARKLALRQ